MKSQAKNLDLKTASRTVHTPKCHMQAGAMQLFTVGYTSVLPLTNGFEHGLSYLGAPILASHAKLNTYSLKVTVRVVFSQPKVYLVA
jgi:hypothetical protein